MQLFGSDGIGFVLDIESPGRVPEELDRVSAMKRLARRRIASHLRHAAGDGHRVDAPLLQELIQRRVRKRTRLCR